MTMPWQPPRITRRSRPRAMRPSRRMFLRGLAAGGAITVGLPLFEMLLNDHGDAMANGEELPTRFGLWFFGNGVRLHSWTPTQGADWQVPNDGQLAALVPHKEYVSVCSGLDVKTPRHPHHSGMSAVCSGGPHLKVDDVRDTIVSTMKYPSVDQIAADYFFEQQPTPYRSLEAAVTRFRGTDEGTSFQYLSHNGSVNGETNINPSEQSPQRFFDRLFGNETADPLIKQARASVLNAVSDQITDLQPKLSAGDRQRLAQHLDSIADLERRLGAPSPSCTKPDAPGDFPDVGGDEQMAEKNAAMSDLMALALACNLTRSFSIMFSTCGSGAVMWPAGATDGQHYMNHTEPSPWTKQHESVKFTMSQLAYFLDRLKQTPEGDGHLLDQCSILVCTEHTEGWTHSQDDMPILICGKGGGRLRGNVHQRDDGGNVSKAGMTALRGAGLPLTTFGHEQGAVTSGMTDLEV